jgi:hypothetical protein
MILKPITSGSISGVGLIACQSKLLGGVLISVDGTNAGTVVVRKDSETGDVVFHMVAFRPVFCGNPILASDILYYSITGTGCTAMLYEWIE